MALLGQQVNEALGLDPDANASAPSRTQMMFSRSSTMAEQVRGVEQAAMALVKKGALPESVLDELRAVFNNLHSTERKISMARNAPAYQTFFQKWANVPAHWLEAIQRVNATYDLEPPRDLFNGHTFDEFVSDQHELYRASVETLNQGAAKHGLEGRDVKPDAIHPKRRRGTAMRVPVVGKLATGIIDAVPNIASEISGRQKGWMNLPDASLIEKMQDVIRNSVRRVDGQYIVPRKRMPYLDTKGNGRTPLDEGLVKGVITDGPNKGDFLIGDEQAYQRFYDEEPARFTLHRNNYRNIYQDDEFKISDLVSKFERKLPYIPGVHTISVLDIIDEARQIAEHGAAMIGQDVGLPEKLQELAHRISKAVVDPKDKYLAEGLQKALWGMDTQKALGETSLAFRAYDQLGRVTNDDKTLLARLEAAARPAAYDISLNLSATAAAKQVAQNVSQGFMRGPKYGLQNMARIGKRSVQAPFTWMGVGEKLGDDMGRTTASGYGGFVTGNAAQEAAIREAAPYVLAEALSNPNSKRALRRWYSDQDIRLLEDSYVDGGLDMSVPGVDELVEGQVMRDMEIIMGANSKTSQPALMKRVHPGLRMFKSTPLQILTSVNHLFSPGGMLDQGSTVKNLLARRKMAYMVTSWVASKVISGTVKGKTAMLALGAASPMTALLLGLRAVADGDNDTEQRSWEITKALANAIATNEGGIADRMLALGITLSSATMASMFPGGNPDALIERFYLNDASRKDLGMGREMWSTAGDFAEAFAPSLGILANTVAGPIKAYNQSFQGEPEFGKPTKLYAGSSLEGAMYMMRNMPVLRDVTWRDGKVIPMKALKEAPKPSQVNRIETELLRRN